MTILFRGDYLSLLVIRPQGGIQLSRLAYSLAHGLLRAFGKALRAKARNGRRCLFFATLRSTGHNTGNGFITGIRACRCPTWHVKVNIIP